MIFYKRYTKLDWRIHLYICTLCVNPIWYMNYVYHIHVCMMYFWINIGDVNIGDICTLCVNANWYMNYVYHIHVCMIYVLKQINNIFICVFRVYSVHIAYLPLKSWYCTSIIGTSLVEPFTFAHSACGPIVPVYVYIYVYIQKYCIHNIGWLRSVGSTKL